MKPYIELKGASGAIYRYKLAEDADPRTTIAGNFLYLDDIGTVLFAGETNNLVGANVRWSEAVNRHHAKTLYTRLNVSGASRAEEHADVLAALDPIMNREA